MTENLDASNAKLPLFFKAPAPLTFERHGQAGIVPTMNLSFASATNAILVNVAEFIEAAKHFPIVFTADKNPIPVAVVGLEESNYFVGAEGNWKKGAYIPAYVRKYPFVLSSLPDREEMLLCIDEGAADYRTTIGFGVEALYDGQKQPTPLLKNALDFCSAFQNHLQTTRQFCDALVEHQLFVTNQSEATLPNGRKILIGGFQMIDEQKFGELSDAAFLDLRKKGFLPFIYLALMSTTNWRTLIDMATELEAKSAA
ncbi:MAG: SapC family protein [Rickettsiales bacterium]|nr:SapC family protein [Rickettsiales bacterium]